MINPQEIKVIAGLGNPGSQYADTRHNIGFALLDALRAEDSSAAAWREHSGAQAVAISVEDQNVFLIKPMTYMNNSGGPLRAFLNFYKFEYSQLVVVYDDIDLPFGALRLKLGGGDGGHNGVRSIAAELNHRDFIRVRLGVGRPPPEFGAESAAARWVLSKFTKQEEPIVEELLKRGVGALQELVRSGLKLAQTRFNSVPDKPQEP